MIMKYLSHIHYDFIVMDAVLFYHIMHETMSHKLILIFCGQTHTFIYLSIMEL